MLTEKIRFQNRGLPFFFFLTTLPRFVKRAQFFRIFFLEPFPKKNWLKLKHSFGFPRPDSPQIHPPFNLSIYTTGSVPCGSDDHLIFLTSVCSSPSTPLSCSEECTIHDLPRKYSVFPYSSPHFTLGSFPPQTSWSE